MACLRRDVSKKAKVIWLVMLSVSLSFFCIEVSYVFQEYAKHPVGSQWTRKSENHFKFPTVLLCPERWINETKAIKEYGLSELAIVYLAAYTIVENPSLQEHELFNDVVGNFTFVRNQIEDVIAEYKIEEPSIPNLLLQLAYSFNEIASYTNPFMGVAIDDLERNEIALVTNYGVCFRRIIPKYSKEMLPTPIGDLKIDIRFSDSYVLKRPNLVKVFVGYFDGDALPAAPLNLAKGFSYQVKVKSTHSIQIPSDKNWCEDKLVDSSYRRACEYHCFNTALWTPCYGCHFKAGLNISYDQLCNPIQIMVYNQYRGTNHSILRNINTDGCDENNWATIFESCLASCPNEPCDIWTHELSVVDTPLNMFVKETDTISLESAQLWLSSATPFVHLEMKEIWTYTWHTFISNVGGQMGLWLGVSLLSLLRLWQMCCINVYKGYRGIHAEVSLKRARKRTVQEGLNSTYWLKGDHVPAAQRRTVHRNGDVTSPLTDVTDSGPALAETEYIDDTCSSTDDAGHSANDSNDVVSRHSGVTVHNNDNGSRPGPLIRALIPSFCSTNRFTNHVPDCEVHMV